MPQNPEGMRRLPPISDPRPRAAPSQAKSAASPPLLPPQVKGRSSSGVAVVSFGLNRSLNLPDSVESTLDLRGCKVRPQRGFEHSKESMVCGTLVFAKMMPPASRINSIIYRQMDGTISVDYRVSGGGIADLRRVVRRCIRPSAPNISLSKRNKID